MSNVEEFHAACLGSQPLRIEVGVPGGGGVVLEIPRPWAIIGTGPGVDVDLSKFAGDEVPSRLIYFQLIAGHLFAAALTRTVPVLLNGESFSPRWVRPGDEFTVGSAAVRPLNPNQNGTTPPDWHPSKSRGSASLYQLECQFAINGDQLIPCRRAVWLVGGGRPAKLQFPATDLAPVHAAFVATPTGVWVVGLGPTGSLTLDGVVTSVAKLHTRAVVGLATRHFQFHPTGSSPKLTPVSTAEPTPTPDAVAVLDQVSDLQRQTFEQFQQVLGSVVHMVGTVMADQRQFVKDELDRMERLLAERSVLAAPPAALPAAPPAALPAASPPAPTPMPPRPAPTHASPAADAALHSWVQTQLSSLEQNQRSLWQRLKDQLAGGGRT